jgi:hypothetical protein
MKKFFLVHYAGVILFIASMIAGAFLFQDYGVSWDEPIQRDIGLTTYGYVFHNDQTLKTYKFKNMGTGFELPLIFMEKFLKLHDTRPIYFARHFVTHFFFLIGGFCLYLLSYRLYKDQFIACLGFIMLVFHPRIYGHSFFNCKDIPFLSAFIIAMFFCQIAFERNRLWWYLLAGAACGYAASIRAMEIIVIPVISLFFIADIIANLRAKRQLLTSVCGFLLYISGFCLTLYVSWPVLWGNPIHYFHEQFSSLANIKYGGAALFNGKFYGGDLLPWNYMPVWFSITTPVLWLATGILGFLWVAIDIGRSFPKYLVNSRERNNILYITCFLGPVLAMWIFNGVNVDDWRHLYFIYPSFVMLALFAISKLVRGKRRIAVWAACAAQMLFVAFFIVKNHPYEQLYFNGLVPHKKEYLRYNYDLDYWGTAYRNGLEYILSNDDRPVLRIYCWVGPIQGNVDILPEESRKRITIVDKNENPDYFITNFRNHPEEYPYTSIFYELKILNNTFFRVYKIK